MKKWVFIWGLIMGFAAVHAQVTDKSGVCKFILADQTAVTLVRGYEQSGANTYFYLPVNLRLAENKDHYPEFSFLTYKDDKEVAVIGSVLHFLMYWGLTKKQLTELEERLHTIDSTSLIAGPVALEMPLDVPSFKIIGESAFSKLLRQKLTMQPDAPVFPETRLALSYRFNGDETKIIEEALQNLHKLEKEGIELKYVMRSSDSQRRINLQNGSSYTLWVSFKDLFSLVSLSNQRSK